MAESNPPAELQLVVFSLEQQRYALPLKQVERVERMVAVAPFPRAPAVISGVIDVQGDLVPVVNLRQRFRLRVRPPRLNDHLIVVRTARRRLALVVDGVDSVQTFDPGAAMAPDAVVPGLEFIRGLVRIPGAGIVFVHDLDTVLSLEEAAALDAAMEAPVV